jgi:hypothetical protein
MVLLEGTAPSYTDSQSIILLLELQQHKTFMVGPGEVESPFH